MLDLALRPRNRIDHGETARYRAKQIDPVKFLARNAALFGAPKTKSADGEPKATKQKADQRSAAR